MRDRLIEPILRSRCCTRALRDPQPPLPPISLTARHLLPRRPPTRIGGRAYTLTTRLVGGDGGVSLQNLLLQQAVNAYTVSAARKAALAWAMAERTAGVSLIAFNITKS
jgi:hypothetical protein